MVNRLTLSASVPMIPSVCQPYVTVLWLRYISVDVTYMNMDNVTLAAMLSGRGPTISIPLHRWVIRRQALAMFTRYISEHFSSGLVHSICRLNCSDCCVMWSRQVRSP